MCLAKVDKVIQEPKSNIGYKVCAISGKNLHSVYVGRSRILYKTKVNHDHNRDIIRSGYDESYPAGYHIFLDRENAVRWEHYHCRDVKGIIKKVRFWDVVATGVESISAPNQVVVVRRFRFMRDRR